VPLTTVEGKATKPTLKDDWGKETEVDYERASFVYSLQSTERLKEGGYHQSSSPNLASESISREGWVAKLTILVDLSEIMKRAREYES
jgi:hypothetical protein